MHISPIEVKKKGGIVHFVANMKNMDREKAFLAAIARVRRERRPRGPGRERAAGGRDAKAKEDGRKGPSEGSKCAKCQSEKNG